MRKLPEYFAGQALAGLMGKPYDPVQIANRAWAISDAMMLQRGARQKQLKYMRAEHDADVEYGMEDIAERYHSSRWCVECGHWSPPEIWLCDCNSEEEKDG
jgi:hypothetical protein